MTPLDQTLSVDQQGGGTDLRDETRQHETRYGDKKYTRAALIGGALLITAWTLLRFWTERSIFDLVGQQILARSIVNGGALDATVGATHYIAKIFLVYVPFEAIGIEPRASLVLMTLVLNIGTFVAIVFAIRFILRELNISMSPASTAGLLWLAASAGSVFWIAFANSRNIEVAAGVWMVAVALRLLSRPSRKIWFGWTGLATVTFFMDPMQVYMTGLPLLIYSALVAAQHPRQRWSRALKPAALILGGLVTSLVLARLVLAAVQAMSGLEVIKAEDSVLGLANFLSQLVEAAKGAAAANVRLFAGYLDDGGRLRQLVALVAIVGTVGIWCYLAVRRQVPSPALLFTVVFFMTIQVVYLASGQSLNGDTSRYLIMSAPVLVIAIASIPPTRGRNIATALMTVVIVSNSLYLATALPAAWSERFSPDRRLSEVSRLTNDFDDVTFYASMDTALPTMFYHRQSIVLPLACSEHRLSQSRTFFPSAEFHKVQDGPSRSAAIILDGRDEITNYPSVCDRHDIEQQLGPPAGERILDDGAAVLFYAADKVSF